MYEMSYVFIYFKDIIMINDIICGNQNTPYLEYKDYLKYRDLCAVACQGGGAKGSWQAGVLYGLNQNNINIKTFFGTSVGALNAALCHTNQYDLKNSGTINLH